MKLRRILLALRPRLAEAATAVLQDWQADEDGMDDVYGGGGVCDDVSRAMSDVLSSTVPDIQITEGGHDGDDHSWLIVKLGSEVYGVDIPPDAYESGGGMSWRKTADVVGPADVAVFECWWPDGDDDMVPESIQAKITEGTVTRDDFNLLIETSFKSAQERILRRTRTRDSNDGHDDEGHAGPPRVGSRIAPRRGGGKLNDPTRTARGRRAVTRREGAEGRYAEAAEFILEHRGSDRVPLEEVADRPALRKLTVRLLTVENRDRDWLYELYRKLEA